MKRYVQSIDVSDTVQVAARRMREANVGILPVCEANGRVLGVVTDRDLAVRVCAEDLEASTTKVASVMTSAVLSCKPDDPVGRAEALMRKHRITRVIIIDDAGALAGVLSLSDLAFYEPSARAGRTLRAVSERKYEPESGP